MLHRGDTQRDTQANTSAGNSREATIKEQKKLSAKTFSSSNTEELTADHKITAALTHEDKTREIFLQTTIVPLNVGGEIVHLRDLLDSASKTTNNRSCVTTTSGKVKEKSLVFLVWEEMKCRLIADMLTFAFNRNRLRYPF